MSRDAQLSQMRLEHEAKVREIEGYADLSRTGKDKRIAEETERYNKAREAEEQRTRQSLQADIDAAYKTIHRQDETPSLDPQVETAKQLRRANIRQDVLDALEHGTDPVAAYERAIRAGDAERAAIIGQLGERYLKDTGRRRQLRRLVEENEPEAKQQARRRLAELETEQNSFEVGAALQRTLRERRERRPSVTPSRGWNVPPKDPAA